jgi:hypothetical protein
MFLHFHHYLAWLAPCDVVWDMGLVFVHQLPGLVVPKSNDSGTRPLMARLCVLVGRALNRLFQTIIQDMRSLYELYRSTKQARPYSKTLVWPKMMAHC